VRAVACARPGAAAILLLSVAMSCARADDYSALLRAKKYEQAAAVINAALAKDANDAGALNAKARLLAAQAPDTRIDEAVALAEKCVALHPENAACHDALGRTMGTKALMKGIFASLGSAGTIRESFKTAVRLDPRNMGARFDLLQYYLQAPGIVGGGRDKATALIADTAKVNAEGARMMGALADLADGKAASAEAQALKINVGGDEDIAETQRDILLGAGWTALKAGKFEDAMRSMREAQKRFPNADGPYFGIGAVLQAEGKHADAVAALQQANALAPWSEFDYQMGVSWQALGDAPKARAAFEKALAARIALRKEHRADAQKRLSTLKGA
jgi:tetratricopeptide (TPR) repeat protein